MKDKAFLERLRALHWKAAGVLTQIDSCGPTEMIGAAFDGRELTLLRDELKECQKILNEVGGNQ